MPKKCIKVDFDKDAKLPVNYFKCNTCNLKWIWEPCMEKWHLSKEH